MTGPAAVACRGPCAQVIYRGGRVGDDGQVTDLPFTDGQDLLTDFADSACPVGGTAAGCPNTTEARAITAEEQPRQLRQLIKAAQARLPRSRSLLLPALVANTPAEIAVTWPAPMPDGTYQVTIGQEFAQPVLLGAIRAAVKAGSRTAQGCTLLVGSTRDVADGAAGLHVVAVP